MGGRALTSASSDAVETVFVPIAPCRLIDTRAGTENVGPRATPIPADTEVAFGAFDGDDGNSTCEIPSTARAIATNAVVAWPTARTYIALYPGDVANPGTANINVVAGQAPTPNAANIPLAPDGTFNVYNAFGTVDFILDVNGYYQPSTAAAATPIDGEPGATGATGPQGETGETGATGATGPQGEQGEQGDTGETGPAGPQGETGEIGPAGPQGEQGEAGPAGPAAATEITELTADHVIAPDATLDATTPACEEGAVALSGGVSAAEGSTAADAVLHSLSPGADAWAFSMTNTSASVITVTAHTLCAFGSTEAGVTETSTTTTLPGSSTTTSTTTTSSTTTTTSTTSTTEPPPVEGGPSIDGVATSQSNVSGGDTFAITVEVSDPDGINAVYFIFTRGGFQADFCGNGPMTRTSGTQYDGTWSFDCAVPGGTTSGSYEIMPIAIDLLGNYTNANNGTMDPTRGFFTVS